MENKIKRKCPVCGEFVKIDLFWQGECQRCGWYSDIDAENHEDKVIFPNMISLKKAQELYKQGKPFKPSLSDFLDGFKMYGETTFQYKNLVCDLTRSNNDGGIVFGWDREHIFYFDGKEDFIQNAKIGDKYVRDIWDEVVDPNYM